MPEEKKGEGVFADFAGADGLLELADRLAQATGNQDAKDRVRQIKERLGSKEQQGSQPPGQGQEEYSQAEEGSSGVVDGFFDLLTKFASQTGEGEIDLGGEHKGRYSAGVHIGSIPPGVCAGSRGRPAQEQPAERVGRTVRKPSKTSKPAAKPEDRQPQPDVMEEDDYLLVVIDMPGVEKQEVQLNQEGNKLNLTTTGQRKHNLKIVLPAPVDLESATLSVNNGVVSLRLPKCP